MNDFGQVVGTYFPTLERTPFIWTHDTGIVELPPLPGFEFHPSAAINNVLGEDGIGQAIFNTKNTAMEFNRGFLFDDGMWTELPSQIQSGNSYAAAINDQGQICGFRHTTQMNYVAFRWENGIFSDFDDPLGPVIPHAINAGGTVVGWVLSSPAIFVWNDQFQFVGGLFEGSEYEYARAIDAFGRIALTVIDRNGLWRLFLLEKGKTHEVATPPGLPGADFMAMNDLGQIVAYSYSPDQPFPQGVTIVQHGEATFLHELCTLPANASGIFIRGLNNSGQLAGVLELDDSLQEVLVVLTPKDRPLGDLDCDCTVGAFDLAMLLSDWGPCDSVGFCRSDIVDSATFQPPGDGVVDAADLAVVLGNWGASTAVR